MGRAAGSAKQAVMVLGQMGNFGVVATSVAGCHDVRRDEAVAVSHDLLIPWVKGEG